MISVIIPVYNGEKVIKRCLDSVAAQTFTDLEIIVVDDGSQDGTEKAVREFNDSRIKYIKQQNRGQGLARNNGVSAARGECLAFVDADDTICRDMLECMERAMRENGAEVVQCGINDIFGGRVVPRTVALDETVTVKDREEYAKTYFRGLYHTNEVCNKLIRKDFWEKNRLCFDDTREVFSEDFLVNIRMLSCIRRITFIGKPLYNYYIAEAGHCLSGKEERLEKICCLFHRGIEESCAEVIPSVKCAAAEVIAEYCFSAEKKEIAKRVLADREVTGYFRTAAVYDCSLKHSVIMTALAYLPVWAKIKVIELYVGKRKKHLPKPE